MSTNEDRTIPATWEEFQRARREAFVLGCAFGGYQNAEELAAEVRRHYPITRKVPRVVSVWGGTAHFNERGHLLFENLRGEPMSKYGLAPESVAAIRDLLANPFEEVSE